jgi:replicative DNA helicase
MAKRPKLRLTWQRDILNVLLKDDDIIRRSRGTLRPVYFTSVPYRWLCKKIFAHYEKYGTTLDRRSLKIELRKYVKEPDERKAYRLALLPLYKHKVKSKRYIVDTIHEWSETQSFALVLKKAAEFGEKGDLEKAKQAVTSSFLFDVSRKEYIMRDFTGEWKQRQKRRKQLKQQVEDGTRRQLKFGLGPLDNVCQIFTDMSSLIVLAATSGVGKSIMSINVGANSFLNNLKIAHFVFENVIEQAEGRYDSRILAYPYRDIMNHRWKKKALREARKHMRDLAKKFKGNLKLFHFPIDTCSVIMAEGLLRELEIAEGWTPDVIIYDSLDHMVPSEKQESHRLNVSKVYKDAKRQSEIRKIPVVTTSHLKASERHQVGRQEGFSESYDKARLADVWITISQSVEQEDDGEALILLDKNRDDEGNLKLLVDLLYHVMYIRFKEVVE